MVKAESTITAISPTSGSIFGGWELTITGTHFVTHLLDNSVSIGGEVCTITASTATELKCMMPRVRRSLTDTTTPYKAKAGVAVHVALKLVELSVCKIGSGCLIDYTDAKTPYCS